MAIPARPARCRKTIKRGQGGRIVEGKSFRLADEVRNHAAGRSGHPRAPRAGSAVILSVGLDELDPAPVAAHGEAEERRQRLGS
jgi:hypothetical protein